MDIRGKLVEFLSIITCPNAICNFCEHFKNKGACEKHIKELIADNMIAHGVTVQKHGRWVFHESEYLDYVECSECHDDFVSCEEDCAVTNYCPNCGAKMDGE